MTTTAVDVRPWIGRKQAAILAHRSEMARPRSLPALLTGLPDSERAHILGTEWFICYDLAPGRVPGPRAQDLPRPATERPS
ncbi:hypothetical protein [Streptomyces sp. NPDC056401]|uniref:hypothetical protein n=1 Tax=Streptomyces sp. NPDC056401 TaxID=3345809 RepID=UPI0035DE7698